MSAPRKKAPAKKAPAKRASRAKRPPVPPLPEAAARIRLEKAIAEQRALDLHWTDPDGAKITVIVELPERTWWDNVSEGDTMMLPVLDVAEQGPQRQRPRREPSAG